MQTSANVSDLETQVTSLQQTLLQAKNLMHVRLQDAISGQKQAEKTVKVCQAVVQSRSQGAIFVMHPIKGVLANRLPAIYSVYLDPCSANQHGPKLRCTRGFALTG